MYIMLEVIPLYTLRGANWYMGLERCNPNTAMTLTNMPTYLRAKSMGGQGSFLACYCDPSGSWNNEFDISK